MKAHVADYQYKIYCLRIEPSSAPMVCITDYVRDLVIGANTYKSGSGYQFSGVDHDSSMSPGSFDLEGVLDVAGIDRDALASGIYDDARIFLFATTWHTPIADEEPIAKALLGKTEIKDGRYKCEAMMLIDALNQKVGQTYGASCKKTFGGTEFAGCKKVPVIRTATVVSITDRYTFTVTGLVDPDALFIAGAAKFTSGPNAALKAQRIKTYAAGVVTLHDAAYYAVQVGDTVQLTEGCQQRQEDCIAKGNILNFGGFSFVPTSHQAAKWGSQ
ncbi:DUF2163 domain-containing protein [Pseudomonas cavernicola]|uniref:DUF2163 domain-containing protein n=1 Tax=Pseudomonas cavernicola TaxID=2320866 RepID=A0A418XEG2_9PSED|nr:DUF2163 domain-containing protein [Pseudomonas cavernicola]RJG10906.1 DUF2163 domain-containing protein [Pseudomonas cavernicola]